MKNILIATPSYDGKVHIDYLSTFVGFLKATPEANITLNTVIGNSLITQARDFLITTFIDNPSYDYMLFWDSDIGVPEYALYKLLCRNKDVIGLPVPMKVQGINSISMGKILSEEGDILEVTGIPTAFLLISRKVGDALKEAFKDKKYKNPASAISPNSVTEIYKIFTTEVKGDAFYGEDYVFCNTLRELGFKVYADISIPVRHWGSSCYIFTKEMLKEEGKKKEG